MVVAYCTESPLPVVEFLQQIQDWKPVAETPLSSDGLLIAAIYNNSREDKGAQMNLHNTVEYKDPYRLTNEWQSKVSVSGS